MKINGFQKLTLLDFPNKTACTIFTPGCNFRCPFCHNALLVTEINENYNIEDSEIFDYLSKRQGLLDGVCITGGEPLIQDGIEEFIKKIKDMGYLVKLDTNGSRPERLSSLINNGLLDYVAMDVKNSIPHYGKTIGIEGFDCTSIIDSINLLLESKIDFEFRTTVVREFHTKDDLAEVCEIVKDAPNYYLQQFVDSGGTIQKGLSAYPETELKSIYSELCKTYKNVHLRGVK